MNASMTIKSSTPPEGVPDISQLAIRIANGFMTNFDTNQDGSINKDEFIRGMASKGISAEKAAAQFMAVDIKGNGVVTKQDIQAAVKNGAFAGGPRGGRGGGGGGAMRLQSAAKPAGASYAQAASLTDVSAVDSPQMATAEAEIGKTKSAPDSTEPSDGDSDRAAASDSSQTARSAQQADVVSYKRSVGRQLDQYV